MTHTFPHNLFTVTRHICCCLSGSFPSLGDQRNTRSRRMLIPGYPLGVTCDGMNKCARCFLGLLARTCRVVLPRRSFATSVWCASASPSSHGRPVCLMLLHLAAPVPPSCPLIRTWSAKPFTTPVRTNQDKDDFHVISALLFLTRVVQHSQSCMCSDHRIPGKGR